jgi:ubiquinone/menaquinone biosynthesis C-methylase UbiE/chorismate mutase
MKKITPLEILAGRLESVDRHLVHLLARRIHLAREVVMIKLQGANPLYRPKIETDRLNQVSAWASAEGINPEFARSILYSIIGESCKAQMVVADKFRLEGTFEKFTPSRDELRGNLVALADAWAPRYESEYGLAHPATLEFNKYEQALIDQMASQAPDRALVLDLGCATGREIRRLSKRFRKLRGFDISESMIEQGNLILADGSVNNVCLEVCDIEQRLPVEDSSVSLVIMNGGTGSDVFELKRLLIEIKRVLKPHGRFVLSFYNKESWAQRVFMPWPLGLVAGIDQDRDCLEVWSGNGIIPIHAKSYTIKEIEELMPDHLCPLQISTYPTLSAVLPPEITSATKPDDTVDLIDTLIAQTEMGLGAYVVIAGEKV